MCERSTQTIVSAKRESHNGVGSGACLRALGNFLDALWCNLSLPGTSFFSIFMILFFNLESQFPPSAHPESFYIFIFHILYRQSDNWGTFVLHVDGFWMVPRKNTLGVRVLVIIISVLKYSSYVSVSSPSSCSVNCTVSLKTASINGFPSW